MSPSVAAREGLRRKFMDWRAGQRRLPPFAACMCMRIYYGRFTTSSRARRRRNSTPPGGSTTARRAARHEEEEEDTSRPGAGAPAKPRRLAFYLKRTPDAHPGGARASRIAVEWCFAPVAPAWRSGAAWRSVPVGVLAGWPIWQGRPFSGGPALSARFAWRPVKVFAVKAVPLALLRTPLPTAPRAAGVAGSRGRFICAFFHSRRWKTDLRWCDAPVRRLFACRARTRAGPPAPQHRVP